MDQIIIELQKLCGLVKQKLQEVEHREKLVGDREVILEERLAGHAEKHQDILTREAAVASIENVEKQRTENENNAREINESSARHEEEKRIFKTWLEGEKGNLAEGKKSLDSAWAELNAAKKNMENEIAKQVKELLSKFEK